MQENNFVQQQDDTLNWIVHSSSNSERFDFLRRLLDVWPEDELPGINGLLSKAKKRRKRRRVTLEAPEGSVSVPTPVSVPETSVSAPGWFYNHKKVYSLDCEMVSMDTGLRKNNGTIKWKQVAGTVAVYDENMEKVLSVKIRRDQYRTTPFTRRLNGIDDKTLKQEGCLPIADVQKQLTELFRGSLVVGLNILNDFDSLDLPPGDFDIFDLQWYYYIEKDNQGGEPIYEKLSLRSLKLISDS